MSDFHDTPKHPKAREPHQCIACCATIPTGEQHTQQTGFYDGRAYRNRYHNECWDALNEGGEFEFIPGELDPPERIANSA